MDYDEVEIATTCLVGALCARSRRRRRRVRTSWIKPWIATRETDPAFHKLMKDLQTDPGTLIRKIICAWP